MITLGTNVDFQNVSLDRQLMDIMVTAVEVKIILMHNLLFGCQCTHLRQRQKCDGMKRALS